MKKCQMLLLALVLIFAGQSVAVLMGSDGYADRVIIRDDGNGNAVWYVDQSGPGGFGDGQAELIGGFGLMSDKHMIGDVNGDGYADRVVGRLHLSGNYWSYFASFSTSSGFGAGGNVSGSFGGPGAVPFAAADLNGDGLADRIATSITPQSSRNYWVSETGPGGTFPGGNHGTSIFGGTNTSLVGMYDVNGDGIADRVDAFNNNWRVDFGPSAGGFGDSSPDWTGYYGGTGSNITRLIGDVSNDGYGDRVLATLDGNGHYNWIASISTSSGFGLTGTDYNQQSYFGETGDIVLLHDVVVPEPVTVALLGLGVVGIRGFRKKS